MKKTLLHLILFLSLSVSAQDFWTPVASFPEQTFAPKQIAIVDANVVWVYGYNGWNPGTTAQQWFRTTDGGTTWTQGNFSLGNADLQVSALHAVSETVAYVSANATIPSVSGGIWMTSDAGATWARQPNSFNIGESFVNFVHLWNATDGIAVGDPNNGYFEIYKTQNAGQNWDRVASANIAAPLSGETGYTLHYETRNNSIWFGTNKGRIFKSNDRGQHWHAVQSPLSDFGSSESRGRFAFKNDNEGLLIDGDTYGQYKTSDAGNTWSVENPITFSAARNANILFIPETPNAYFSWGAEFLTDMRGASYTADGGISWIDLDEIDQLDVMTAKFKNFEVGFCLGYRIHDTSPRDLIFFKLGEDTFRRFLSSNDQPVMTKLSVVPNPATDLVEITGKNIQSVVISDISGKKVLTQNFAISDSVSLDLSKFQNGIYFAAINTNTETASIIKIVKK